MGDELPQRRDPVGIAGEQRADRLGLGGRVEILSVAFLRRLPLRPRRLRQTAKHRLSVVGLAALATDRAEQGFCGGGHPVHSPSSA